MASAGEVNSGGGNGAQGGDEMARGRRWRASTRPQRAEDETVPNFTV